MAAGIAAHSQFRDLKNVDIVRKVMEVNFMGQVLLMRHALKELRQSKGQVVLISSVSGVAPLGYRAAYCASKAASDQFFLSLACEEPDIRLSIMVPDTFTGSNFRSNSLVQASDMEQRGGK